MTQEKIDSYIKLLVAERNIRNIIGTTDIKLIYAKHIIPSLELGSIILEDNGIDVGTGNGLPGIIIAISNPAKNIVLMDAKISRINFLYKVKKELDIKNISILQMRCEDAGHNELYRESFEFGTCRAVANLRISSELVLPLLKKGGSFYAQCGKFIEKDINNAKEIISELGGEISEIKKNNVLLIAKRGQTPEGYPRKWNKLVRR